MVSGVVLYVLGSVIIKKRNMNELAILAHIWTQRGKLTAHHRVLNFLCKCGYRVRSVAVRGNVIDHLQTRQYQPA